jgi:hypothetical protein
LKFRKPKNTHSKLASYKIYVAENIHTSTLQTQDKKSKPKRLDSFTRHSLL